MHVQIPILALFSAVAQGATLQPRAATAIPTNSFASFDKYWNYLYPGGLTDHNGGARMDKEHVSFQGDNTLVLTSEPVTGEPPSHFGGRTIPINYRAGTIHSKANFTVQAGGGYDFSAEFLFKEPWAGCWPAFWVSGSEEWPPEIDMAEWMGDGKILFNTYNTSSQMASKGLIYENPTAWHSVKTEIRDENGADVSVNFFYDGTLVATQYGKGFVGKPLHLYVVHMRGAGYMILKS